MKSSTERRLLTDDEIDEIVVKVIEPGIVAANCFRAVRKVGLPLPRGQVNQISAALRVSRFSVSEAIRILEIFNAYPTIREQWEHDLATGQLGLRTALFKIRREAEELARQAAAPAPTATPPPPAKKKAKAKRAVSSK